MRLLGKDELDKAGYNPGSDILVAVSSDWKVLVNGIQGCEVALYANPDGDERQIGIYGRDVTLGELESALALFKATPHERTG